MSILYAILELNGLYKGFDTNFSLKNTPNFKVSLMQILGNFKTSVTFL